MKTYRAVGWFAAIVWIMAFIGCKGNNKSQEIREVMESNLRIMEDFITSVEETDDTQVYLAALTKMKASIRELLPRMKELDKKYPALFKLGENKEPSPELKEILKEQLEREAQVRARFVAALQDMMKKTKAPEIMKALKEIYELQNQMYF